LPPFLLAFALPFSFSAYSSKEDKSEISVKWKVEEGAILPSFTSINNKCKGKNDYGQSGENHESIMQALQTKKCGHYS
jgi:hypothetical protein